MKYFNILITGILLAYFANPTYSQSVNSSVDIEVTIGDVEIEVGAEIGRKKLGCTKFGVCNITVDAGSKDKIVHISNNTKTGQLVFRISAEGLKKTQADKIQYLEGKTSVMIEEEWVLPETIRQQLKMSNKFVCKPGTYPVRKSGQYYLIGFKA